MPEQAEHAIIRCRLPEHFEKARDGKGQDRAENLLDVLTHPDVKVGAADGVARERAVLNLERLLRAQATLPADPEGLRLLARQRDESSSTVSGQTTHQLEEFTAAVIAASA